MNPVALRALILVTELMTFLTVTAFMTFFISRASAPVFEPGSTPPAEFPVIAYDGDRNQPEAKRYHVLSWGEWEGFAAGHPGASLLLPEQSASLRLGGQGEAAFSVTEGSESRQTVELTWRAGSAERRARYVTEGRTVEPRDFLTIGTKTFLLAALAGFGVGMLIGQLMRRRWLPRPGTIVPLPPK